MLSQQLAVELVHVSRTGMVCFAGPCPIPARGSLERLVECESRLPAQTAPALLERYRLIFKRFLSPVSRLPHDFPAPQLTYLGSEQCVRDAVLFVRAEIEGLAGDSFFMKSTHQSHVSRKDIEPIGVRTSEVRAEYFRRAPHRQ